MRVKGWRLVSLALLLMTVLTGCGAGSGESMGISGNTALKDNALLTSADWRAEGSKGALHLVAEPGMTKEKAPRLLRKQLKGDWTIHTQITFNSARRDGSSHAGLALLCDEDNWLIWGPRQNGTLVLSGRLRGEDTGELLSSTAKYSHLRIMKRTGDGPHTRYLAYGADEAYRSWQYIGLFEDSEEIFADQSYGLMAWNADLDVGSGYVVQFDFCNDYVLENYKEPFHSMQPDGAWEAISDSPGQTAAMRGGAAVFTLSQEGRTAMVRHPMFADWIIETELSNLRGETALSGLMVYCGADDWLLFGKDASHQPFISGRIGGKTYSQVGKQTAGRFLRLTKEGRTYRFQASDTGQSWISILSYTDLPGALDGGRYGLSLDCGGLAQATARYEWFSERARPDGIIREIDTVEEICQLTGETGINQTETNWQWGSGDLGSMYELNGTVYMTFGDTFQFNGKGGNWYKNSFAKITNPEFRDGLHFDSMQFNNGGLVNVRGGSDDFSMIPTYGVGIEQDGVPTLYLYMMEIHRWGDGGHWDCNGGAWAVSTDDGASWTLQPPMFEGNSNFIQLAVYEADGELYMLGAPGGGEGCVKLMKVRPSDILERSAYRFYTGVSPDGKPQWSEKETDAVPVVGSVNREIAVTYNAYLESYLMTTLDNVSQQMVLREAPNPWGPWSKPILLFEEAYVEHQDTKNPSFYGCYMLPRYMENGGETVYMTLNKWVPYQITWQKVHFVRNNTNRREE